MTKQKLNLDQSINIISAIAVVLGLVFVGLELRNNSEAVEAATFQSLTDASNEYIMSIATNDEALRVYFKGSADPASLTENEMHRYNLLMRAYWVRMQNVFSQWDRGTLGDEDWALYRSVICDPSSLLKEGGERVTFNNHTQVLRPTFVSYVKECWNNPVANE